MSKQITNPKQMNEIINNIIKKIINNTSLHLESKFVSFIDEFYDEYEPRVFFNRTDSLRNSTHSETYVKNNKAIAEVGYDNYLNHIYASRTNSDGNSYNVTGKMVLDAMIQGLHGAIDSEGRGSFVKVDGINPFNEMEIYIQSSEFEKWLIKEFKKYGLNIKK